MRYGPTCSRGGTGEVFIPEGAGRCQGVLACGFAFGVPLQGVVNWPRGAPSR